MEALISVGVPGARQLPKY